MSVKTKGITVRYCVRHDDFSDQTVTYYRVLKVIDSTDYHPNQTLETREVDGLCASPRWKVTIVGEKS